MKFFRKKSTKLNVKKSSVKSKAIFVSGILFGIIPFIFIVYLLLGPVIKVIQSDYSSKKMIIISEELNIRSDKQKNSYVIGSYKYGTEVNVYNVFENDWAEVSIGDKKGYMSFEFLVLPEVFHIIDGMFGNENAKELISSTKYRIAISTYLQNNNFTSKIPISEREILYGKGVQKEVWQIFAENRKAYYNTFCYGDYNGDKKNDAAFIITNIKTGERKLIVLNIETEVQENFGDLITSTTLDKEYQFIRHIPARYKMIINDSLQRTKVDGILIGTNRDKNLNDIPELMIFNGASIDYHLQEIKGK